MGKSLGQWFMLIIARLRRQRQEDQKSRPAWAKGDCLRCWGYSWVPSSRLCLKEPGHLLKWPPELHPGETPSHPLTSTGECGTPFSLHTQIYFKNKSSGRVAHIIPKLKSWRQEDQFKTSLGYIKPCLKPTNHTITTKEETTKMSVTGVLTSFVNLTQLESMEKREAQ